MVLKFSDIVARANLNVHSAQHLLKYAGEQLELPAAGTQGAHRLFTLQQAVRFALATKLAMGGVNVRHVKAIIQLCERRMGGPSRQPARPLYQSDPRYPWTLEIIEDDLVQLSFTQDARHTDKANTEEYYSLSARRVMSGFDHPGFIQLRGLPISKHLINVTRLEKMLMES